VSGALADRYDLFIFDLDGVVYVGSQPIPAAVKAIGKLHARGARVAYATNNAARRAAEASEHLNRLGVTADPAEVITSAQATAALLAGRLAAGSAVLVVGTEALGEELAAVGLKPVATADETPVAVVQGYGPHVGWQLLAEGCVAVRAGALWVATNADATLPSPRGPLPGNGALVAALATAVGRQPDLVVGKPAPGLFEQAARRQDARRPLVIGDRLDTDIEGANRAGMDSLLVLTGVTGPADVLGAPRELRPTFLAADLDGLFDPAAAIPIAAEPVGWRTVADGADVTLQSAGAGAGSAVAALRALCAAAWPQVDASGRAPRLRADGAAAAAALAALDLSD